MDALRAFLLRTWDAMSDPRWKKPLLIIGALLLLILLGLILLPAAAEGEGLGAPLRESAGRTLRAAAEAAPPSPEPLSLPAETEEDEGWRHEDGRDYYCFPDGSPALGLQRIGGKLYYFDENVVKARALGMDVSFYNGRIDWDRVKEQGIDFVIVRAGGRYWTGGGIYDDCRTREFLRGAKNAGIPAGV